MWKASSIYPLIKDLFNNEIIAYDLVRSPNFEQITQMMKQAVARLAGAKPILHSDQGWQYQMIGYKNILRENGIQQSMSRKGNDLDNSAMEILWMIKNGMLLRQTIWDVQTTGKNNSWVHSLLQPWAHSGETKMGESCEWHSSALELNKSNFLEGQFQ